MIYVLEIKDDSEIVDPSLENQKKYEYAQAHFDRLNQWLEGSGVATRYQHNWLSPKSYNRFSQLLREGTVKGFRSELDVTLAQQVVSRTRFPWTQNWLNRSVQGGPEHDRQF